MPGFPVTGNDAMLDLYGSYPDLTNLTPRTAYNVRQRLDAVTFGVRQRVQVAMRKGRTDGNVNFSQFYDAHLLGDSRFISVR